MAGTGISKSQVSKLCEDIDERVNAFLDRLIEGEWPYLWLDATYLKVRDGGRIVSVAAIIAVLWRKSLKEPASAHFRRHSRWLPSRAPAHCTLPSEGHLHIYAIRLCQISNTKVKSQLASSLAV